MDLGGRQRGGELLKGIDSRIAFECVENEECAAGMIIHELSDAPAEEMQRGLEEFEASFPLPLGQGRSFRISYGKDRTAFIRTLGESRSYVAVKEGRVMGFLEIAVVKLMRPDGTMAPAVYVADIKLRPDARRSMVTARMLQKGGEWARTKSDLWYTLTMDATPQKPPDYSGRVGIPALTEASRVLVVRLPVPAGMTIGREHGRFLATAQQGEELYKRLALGRYALPGGTPEERSIAEPVWLAHPSGLACARFEDRRKVRKLIADNGGELRPVYLSCFAFKDALAAADLIAAALRRAGWLGFNAVRLCVPPGDMAQLRPILRAVSMTETPGAIYATTNAVSGAVWNLNAAEV